MKLRIKNTRYWKNIKLEKNTWNWKPFEDIPYPINLDSESNFLKPLKDKSNISNKDGDTLRPDQIEVLDAIKDKKSALIWAKTGFGKSWLISALADIWGGKTLVLVTSVLLVGQQKKVMEELLGVKVGMVKTGKHDIQDITVTTTRSFQMGKFRDKQFDNIIIDECDKAFTKLIRDEIIRTPFKRIVGLTGTIDKDEDMESFNWKNFDHIVEGGLPAKGSLPDEEKALPRWYRFMHIVESDMTDTPLEEVYYREHANKPYKFKPYSAWIKFREELDNDLDRKIAQFNFINETKGDDKYVIVLLDRVDDIKAFKNAYTKRGIKVYINHGNAKDDMQEWKEKGGIMIAMFSTVGRGFDHPPLTKLYLMFPIKGKTNILQNIGRVIRKLKDKKAYVYYWADSHLDYQRKNFAKEVEAEFGLTIKKI